MDHGFTSACRLDCLIFGLELKACMHAVLTLTGFDRPLVHEKRPSQVVLSSAWAAMARMKGSGRSSKRSGACLGPGLQVSHSNLATPGHPQRFSQDCWALEVHNDLAMVPAQGCAASVRPACSQSTRRWTCQSCACPSGGAHGPDHALFWPI